MTREGYKLFTVAFKSPFSDSYEICGLLFLSAEDHDMVRSGLTFFRDSLPYTEDQIGGKFVFMVDKDFEYIPVLKEVRLNNSNIVNIVNTLEGYYFIWLH